MGMACTLVPLIIIGINMKLDGDKIRTVTHDALVELAESELKNLARDVISETEVAHYLLNVQIKKSLGVAKDQLEEFGGLKLAEDDLVEWDAVNQTTKAVTTLALPKVKLGSSGKWLGQVSDFDTYVPVVDDIGRITEDTATIFQRMNPQGDMLRIATNVDKGGARATGTFIPSSSPVVKKVLGGETFYGRAFVVNQWYVTAYAPIFDDSKQVIGIIYVGIPESMATNKLLNTISKTKVGKTGYIYIINTKGDKAGHYLLSHKRERDGVDISNATDANGRFFIQEMVDAAANMKRGDIREIRYSWKNPSYPEPRDKLVFYTYFEPWDWLIGVGAYEDDFFDGVYEVSAIIDHVILVIMVIILVSGILAVICFLLFARMLDRQLKSLSHRLNLSSEQTYQASHQVSESSNALATGASEQASSLQETRASLESMEEMTASTRENAQKASELTGESRKAADRGVEAMEKMIVAMEDIKTSSNDISAIIKTIDEIAFQTNILALNAAVEAARAGEAGQGFAVVADEVRALAQRSAVAARETSAKIEEAVRSSGNGVNISKDVASQLQKIVEHIRNIDEVVAEIAKASTEQSEGISQITVAVAQMDGLTQASAANSEETAASAEELSTRSIELNQMVEELTLLIEGRTVEASREATHRHLLAE